MQRTVYARAPLLDRLIDTDLKSLREARPLRVLSSKELRASVRNDLERLFNTRCPVPQEELKRRERSVLDYGIPDLSTFSMHNREDSQRIEQIFKQTLAAYEPRLQEVRVIVVKQAGNERLEIKLEAMLVVDEVAEPISFPILIQSKHSGGGVKVFDDG
ncbi:MAG: type VI secretion system baseplate subunit TssE [Gammaproteobacteria bacterium]|nr:type VI secretion system baseplate subunit TssE [Gammaproteobacteria bacterium]